MVLLDAYTEEEVKEEGMKQELCLNLKPSIAPFKAAILPLMKKEELVAKADEIFDILKE